MTDGHAQLTSALSELLPAPEASLAKARVRGRIMAAAREQLEPRPFPSLRPMGLAAAAASAVFALGTGGAIGASASALPGEPLYHVKLAVEEVKSAVVAAGGDPVARAAIQEERATQRVGEVEALAAQGRPIPPAVAAAAVSHAAAATTAAAEVPGPHRAELSQKQQAHQAQRQETLSRVLSEVPSPAQTAIAPALERPDERPNQRPDDRPEQRPGRTSDHGDERGGGRQPHTDSRGSDSNNGQAGPNTGRGSTSTSSGAMRADDRARRAAQPPLPTRTPDRTPEPRPRPAGQGARGPSERSEVARGGSGPERPPDRARPGKSG